MLIGATVALALTIGLMLRNRRMERARHPAEGR
jgi:hypothetical protein